MKFFVALTVFLALSSRPTPAQSVTTANSLTTIHPADSPGTATNAEIHAAQNEFEDFQVVIAGPLSGVSVTAPTLTGPSGAQIPGGEVRLYREGYVNLTKPSNPEGGTGLWPDALIPDVDETANEKRNAFPFDVPMGQNQVVLVEVHVPQNQAPGTYQGSLTVSASGFSASVPVTLLVWNFALPSTSSLVSTFGVGWNTACIAHYGSYDACGGDAGVERMHLMYSRFLLDHRITGNVVYTGPVTCAGTTCDWSHFDQIYGPLFDGTDPASRLSGAKMTSIRYIWGISANQYAAWAAHFRQKGWFDRTFDDTCDEPPNGCAWSDIGSRAAMVHGADAQFRTLVTTDIQDATTQGVANIIDILAPLINFMDDKPGASQFSGNQRSQYNSFLQSNSNSRLWWYQSCMSHGCTGVQDNYFTGWPDLVIDASPVQERAQGILSWLFGVTGVLYYRADLNLPTAWDPNGLYGFGGNGDGTLVYPGKPSVIGGQTDIPVASKRLKNFRDGMEDYELMKLVSDLGDPSFAQQTGQSLFPDPYDTRQTPEALYAAREALAQRVLTLKGSSSAITMVTPLTISPANPVAGQPAIATFTIQNSGSQPVSMQYVFAAGRDTNDSHYDFPVSAPVTLQPGQQFSYSGTQTFAAAGTYSSWPDYYSSDGNWIELASHQNFTVSASGPVRIEQDDTRVITGPPYAWNTGTDSRASAGSYIATQQAGATVQLAFNGTGISVIGTSDSCSGQATVQVDQASRTIDAYSANGGWQRVLYSIAGLAEGSHMLTLTVAGTHQPASCGSWLYFDALDVQP